VNVADGESTCLEKKSILTAGKRGGVSGLNGRDCEKKFLRRGERGKKKSPAAGLYPRRHLRTRGGTTGAAKNDYQESPCPGNQELREPTHSCPQGSQEENLIVETLSNFNSKKEPPSVPILRKAGEVASYEQ